MAEGFRKNLKATNKAFVNVLNRLLRQFPFIFIVFMSIITFGLIMFTKSEQRMTFGLCILITIVSILIYSRNNNYAETLLSFMLGVLTIFTITWDNYTSILFVGFYVAINIIIFFMTTIRLASKVESELTTAASFINLKEHKATYERLNKITKIDTPYNILGGVERAEVIKNLAFMKVPIEEMEESIKNVELIYTVFQLNLKNSCDFFKTLYFLKRRTSSIFNITHLLDLIVDKRLPLTYEEFLDVLNQTKKEIINNKLSMTEYLDLIEESILNGEDVNGTVMKIKNK